MVIIGVDIGGTNTDIGVLDSDGRILGSATISTNVTKGPEDCMKRIAASTTILIKQCDIAENDIAGIGVGCPGPTDRSCGSMVHSPNFPHNWLGFSIGNSLSDRVNLPVEIDNDANAAALGELWAGAGRGIDDFLVLTLGTGIGGGIVANGKIVRGSLGLGAELGHVGVYSGGELCGCGKRGCLEAYASATGMVKMAQKLLKSSEYKKGSSQLEDRRKNRIDAKRIFELSRSGDELATEILKRAGEALGMGIGTLLNVFNPRKVILAGRMAQSLDMMLPYIEESCKKRSFESIFNAVSIEPSGLGVNAGVVGAAAVFAYEHELIRRETPVVGISGSCTIAAANIGVSGMRVAIVDIAEGGKSYKIISQKHVPGRQPSEEAILEETANGFAEVLADRSKKITDLAGFVVTTPGPIDKKNKLVLNSPNMNWQHVDVENKLRRRIKGLTARIYLERDAIAVTLAELYFGLGRTLKNFAAIYIGTGIGAGFVFDGKVFSGVHDQAGEVGHGIIDRRGTQTCRCGNRGCLECYASGVALSRYCAAEIVRGIPTILAPRKADDIYYYDAVEAADKDDEVATRALLEMGQALAIGVSTIVNYLDLEKVIISGPLSRGSEHFLEKVREEASSNIIISDWNKENIITTDIKEIEIAAGVASFVNQYQERR